MLGRNGSGYDFGLCPVKAARLTGCPRRTLPNRLSRAMGAVLMGRGMSATDSALPLVFGALRILGQRCNTDRTIFVTTPQFRLGSAFVLRKMRPLLFVWFHAFAFCEHSVCGLTAKLSRATACTANQVKHRQPCGGVGCRALLDRTGSGCVTKLSAHTLRITVVMLIRYV